VKKLLRVGLEKQKLRGLSCYHESAVIIEYLRKELVIDVADVKREMEGA
jgi:hypothetical protein